MPGEADVHQRDQETEGRRVDGVDEAGREQGVEAVIQVDVGVTEGLDDDVQELGDLRALDDGADLGDGLQCRFMHLLVSVIEHLSQRLDDVWQESEYLLRSAEGHVADRLNCRKLRSPIISEEALEEDGHNLLDSVAAEVPQDLRVRSVGAGSSSGVPWLVGCSRMSHSAQISSTSPLFTISES